MPIKFVLPETLLKKSETEEVVLDVSDHWRLAEAALEVAAHLEQSPWAWCNADAKKLRDALIPPESNEAPVLTPAEEADEAPDVPEGVEVVEMCEGVSLMDVLAMAEQAEQSGYQAHLAGDLYLAVGAEVRRRVYELGSKCGPDCSCH